MTGVLSCQGAIRQKPVGGGLHCQSAGRQVVVGMTGCGVTFSSSYMLSQRISSRAMMPPAASSRPILIPMGSNLGWKGSFLIAVVLCTGGGRSGRAKRLCLQPSSFADPLSPIPIARFKTPLTLAGAAPRIQALSGGGPLDFFACVFDIPSQSMHRIATDGCEGAKHRGQEEEYDAEMDFVHGELWFHALFSQPHAELVVSAMK